MLRVVSTQRVFGSQDPVFGKGDRKSYIDCTVLQDDTTGVCYLFCQAQGQNGNGLTVMLNKDGTPKTNP